VVEMHAWGGAQTWWGGGSLALATRLSHTLSAFGNSIVFLLADAVDPDAGYV